MPVAGENFEKSGSKKHEIKVLNTKTYEIFMPARQFSKIFACGRLTSKIGCFREWWTDFRKKIVGRELKTRLEFGLKFKPRKFVKNEPWNQQKVNHENHEF